MPKLTFAENERALCFHGPLMYEAKVTKAEFWTKEVTSGKPGQLGPHYFVHYKGWKQSWDEWVPEERLKKFNEENIKKQKALIEAQRERDAAERIALAKAAEVEAKKSTGHHHHAGEGGSGRGGHAARAHAESHASHTHASASASASAGAHAGASETTAPAASASVSSAPAATAAAGRREEKRGNKRTREGPDGEEEYQKRTEIKISIPDVLKTQLVDDWEAVTKNMQLVKLPRYPNVDMILEEWLKFLANDEAERRRLAAEVTAGLRIYFNKALGNNLLYRFERGQYSEQLKLDPKDGTEWEMSTRYGAEHLIRLFVNLPELLAHTAMDPETVAVLKDNIASFLSWMTLNKGILFSKDNYENTTSGYQNNNRG